MSSSAPSVSADGRWVAFSSDVSDLVPNDTNGMADVFVTDRRLGLTTRVSVSSTGTEASPVMNPVIGPCFPAISPDGRYVAFATGATNLAAGDTNGLVDVFLHDRVSARTVLVSADPTGLSAQGHSGAQVAWIHGPSPQDLGIDVSADGRFVAFGSTAWNLVSGGTPFVMENHVYVRDVVAGTTRRVDVDSNGTLGHGYGRFVSISDDGRFVAFASSYWPLVPEDTNDRADVYVRDLHLGTTTRVSVSSSGAQSEQSSGMETFCSTPCPIEYLGLAISGDGRFVAFASSSTILHPSNSNGYLNIFVHDRMTGTTGLESRAPGLLGAQDDGLWPSLSRDGRFVAFVSANQSRVPEDTNQALDAFRIDRLTGNVERLSVRSDGSQAKDFGFPAMTSLQLSADGSTAVFASSAADLVPQDTLPQIDVFARTCASWAGDVFCFGLGASCPCGGVSGTFAGCENSAGLGGASLNASGVASVASDSLVLGAAALPPNATIMFLQGTAQVAGGTPFGDGLLCVGGTLVRLALRHSSQGTAAFGAGLGTDPSIAVLGGLPPTGGTRMYQALFRDRVAFCTPATFNLSNAVRIAWAP